jgi:hypothetical protein
MIQPIPADGAFEPMAHTLSARVAVEGGMAGHSRQE